MGENVGLNLVQNNSLHALNGIANALVVGFDQPHNIGSPGSPSADNAELRAELESGALAASGTGIHVNHQS
jgi:hypothetical protein